METYTVRIVIENKPGINDPEGETILHDLILKGSDSKIKDRVAKMLTVKVQEKSPDDLDVMCTSSHGCSFARGLAQNILAFVTWKSMPSITIERYLPLSSLNNAASLPGRTIVRIPTS